MSPARTRTARLRHAAVLLVVGAVVCPSAGTAQTTDDPTVLESRLPSLTGKDRVRALAQLCEAYRSTAPDRSVEYGKQALTLAEAYPDPESEVRALNESAWALMELGRYDEAMASARKGEERAKRWDLRRGEARALNNQGVIQRRLGAFGAALELFQRSLAMYEQVDDQASVATAYNNVSVVLGFDLGDFDQALAAQLESLQIRERLGAPAPLYQSYNTLGVIYDNLDQNTEAIGYLSRALTGWRSLKREPRIAATLSNLAGVYTETGDLDRALRLQREAMALREKLSNTSGMAISLDNVGTILTRMGRLDEARANLDSALAIRRRLGEKKNTAATLLALARLEERAGRSREAEARIDEALRISTDISARDTQRTGFRELATLREARGDARGALAAWRSWARLDSALFNDAGAKRIEALRAEYEADRAQREIERLKSEAALDAAAAQRREILLVVILLSAAVLFLLYRRRVMRRAQRDLEREVRERTAELSEANARLRELSLTDTLTGLRNRRYVFHTVGADVAGAVRAYGDARRAGTEPENADLMFYLLDLDDFKSVNDEFGHASGDMVLTQVARLLEQTARASDIVVRWGGEEFLILSRQSDREGGSAFAERLRQSVRQHMFRCDDGRAVRRTCSVGFAAFPFAPDDPEAVSWEVVLGLADQAAYVAKRSGRDAWVGIRGTGATEPAAVSASGAVVHAMVEAGELEIVSSVKPDDLQARWRDGGDAVSSGTRP